MASRIDTQVGDFTRTGRRNRSVFAILVLIIGILLALGVFPKLVQQLELNRAGQEAAATISETNVVVVHRLAGAEDLVLPASIEGIREIPIYARANGFLRSRYVDIGDHVKKGQLLAVIETPELEQQLQQARAVLDQAGANLKSSQSDLASSIEHVKTAKSQVDGMNAQLAFSEIEVVRYRKLAQDGAVPYETQDQWVRNVETNRAQLQGLSAALVAAQDQVGGNRARVASNEKAVAAAQANVGNLAALTGFQKVYAPCDGIISDRKVDPGVLISQGSTNGTLELLAMVRTDVLRIYVYVPQSAYQSISPGQSVEVSLTEIPGRAFPAKVTNVAGGLDPGSRTLQTEVRIPNPDGLLKPGMYGRVKFAICRKEPPVIIPSNTLVVRSDGLYVALVTANDTVKYVHVTPGRDFGKEVEVVSGLNDGDCLVIEPPDGLREGARIKPVVAAERAAP